jgi:hypothetical protein
MSSLSLDALHQTTELIARVSGLPQHGFTLPGIHLRHCRSAQPTLRAIQDPHHHLQIAKQLRHVRRRGLGLVLLLRFEKQIRRVQNALANRGRTVTPGGVELPGLPRVAVVLGKDRGHALAVFQVGARHWHQILHGHMRRDLAVAHLLLDYFWQQLHQR